MSVLNHLAQAAAVILLIELLVVIVVFLAISGGLAFGLHWVNGKTDWAFGKVNSFLPMVRRYVHLATGYAAQPLISAAGFLEAVESTFQALQRIVREEKQAPPSPPPAARPVKPPSADTTAENPLAIP